MLRGGQRRRAEDTQRAGEDLGLYCARRDLLAVEARARGVVRRRLEAQRAAAVALEAPLVHMLAAVELEPRVDSSGLLAEGECAYCTSSFDFDLSFIW